MREEGVGVGGAAFKGRHGIRYEQTHSDTWLEDAGQRVGVRGVGFRGMSVDTVRNLCVIGSGCCSFEALSL